MGALKAIPGIARGMAEGATAPITLPMREAYAAVTGGPSPSMDQVRQTFQSLQSGDYLRAIPVVGPLASEVIEGGQKIVTPLAKTVVSGAGSITPEEMNTAADTGGAAIANLAAPELARGGVAVAGKISPGMGKLLKFGAKNAPAVVAAASGHPMVAAKLMIRGAIKNAVLEPLGTIITDQVLAKIAANDVEGASAVLSRGLEKNPKAAEAFASAMEKEANATAPRTYSPLDGSPEAVAARNAAKRERLGRPPAETPVVVPGPTSALQRPAFVDEAAGVQAPIDTMPGGYPRGSASPLPPPKIQMPVPGNVKPATVFTKPGPKVKPPAGESASAKALAERQKGVASADDIRAAFGEPPKGAPHGKKGPSGGPLTAAERKEALMKLQRAIAQDADIFAAFGLEQ